MTPDHFYARTLATARAHLARLQGRPRTPATYRRAARTALQQAYQTLPQATVGPVVSALGGPAVLIVRIAVELEADSPPPRPRCE